MCKKHVLTQQAYGASAAWVGRIQEIAEAVNADLGLQAVRIENKLFICQVMLESW